LIFYSAVKSATPVLYIISQHDGVTMVTGPVLRWGRVQTGTFEMVNSGTHFTTYKFPFPMALPAVIVIHHCIVFLGWSEVEWVS